MSGPLHVERQGVGDDVVLLLHGLGCNGAIWDRVVRHLLAHGFSTVVPDAPGHGRSPWHGSYSAGQQAAALCNVVPWDRPVHVIGHSMGAATALLLASGLFGLKVRSVLAIGMKVTWSPEDVLRMSRIRTARIFPERHEAEQQFMRVTGLEGLLNADDRCVVHGLEEVDRGFRLAADPKTVEIAGVPIQTVPSYGQTTTVPVHYCCGSADTLVDVEGLRQIDAKAVEIQGHGHNVHVTGPTEVVDLFMATAAASERV